MAPKKKTPIAESEKPIPLMIRLPPQLHALVEDAARRQHRSLNAQVIHIIAYYFGGEDDTNSRAVTVTDT